MSFGSISAEAHESLAIAMNRLRRQVDTPAKAAKIRRVSYPLPLAIPNAAPSSR